MEQDRHGQWGKHTSVWIDTTPDTNYPQLADADKLDAVVVGGGIAGLTTAYLLVKEGLKVCVVETGSIVRDVTGYTTGKLTLQHGPIYGSLIKNQGMAAAQAYADGNLAGLRKIRTIIEESAIACDYKVTDSYLFSERGQQRSELEAEAGACAQLGIEVSMVEETPLPFEAAALLLPDQAQWHPRKYLLHLAEQITAAGSLIFENTRATEIADGDMPMVKTEQGYLKAPRIVVATNLPFFRQSVFNNIFTEVRSYVLGVKLRGDVPAGVYYSLDQHNPSLRSQPVADGAVFMVGTYNDELQSYETDKQFRNTEAYARSHFDVASIDYHWYTMDKKSPDDMPLIGRMLGEQNIYVASGFSAWGMTTSGMTAIILSDLIMGRENPWADVFDPARLMGV